MTAVMPERASTDPIFSNENVEEALAGLIPDELSAEIDSLADEWEVAAQKIVEALGDLFERTLRVEKSLGFVPLRANPGFDFLDHSKFNDWLTSNHPGLNRIVVSRAAIEDAADFYDPTVPSATRDVRDIEDLPRPVREIAKAELAKAADNGESDATRS